MRALLPSSTFRFAFLAALLVLPALAPGASAAAPVLSSASCSSCVADSAQHTLTLSGSGFTTATTLVTTDPQGRSYDSVASRLTLVSSAQISYRIIPPVGTAGSWSVVARNPDGASMARSFQVTAPAASPPVLSGASCGSCVADSGQHTLTLSGSGFASTTTLVTTDPQGRTYPSDASRLTFVSAGQLTYRIIPPVGTAGSWSVVAKNGGAASASRTFSVVAPTAPAPSLGSASCPSCVADGAQHTLTLSGSHFVGGSSLVTTDPQGRTYASDSGRLTVASASEIRYQIVPPVGTAGTWSVVVRNPDGATSGSRAFSVAAPPTPAPTLFGASCSGCQADGAQHTLTLSGSGFRPGSSLVTTDGEGRSYPSDPARLTVVSDARIDYRIIPPVGTAGAWRVVVQAPEGARSAAQSFTVAAPPAAAPVLTSASCALCIANGAQHTLTLAGSGFAAGVSLVTTDPQGRTYPSDASRLTVVSDARIDYRIIPPTGTSGPWTVVAKSGSGATSVSRGFTVGSPAAPAPVLTSAGCATCLANDAQHELVLTGAHFTAGVKLVTTDPHGRTYESDAARLTVASDGEIRYRIIPPSGTVGAWRVVVRSADGAHATEPRSFTVGAPNPPTLTSATCERCLANEAEHTLTLRGTGFAAGHRLVTTDPQGRPYPSVAARLTIVSATEILYRIIPPAGTSGPWTVVVTTADGGLRSEPRSFTVEAPAAPPSTGSSDPIAKHTLYAPSGVDNSKRVYISPGHSPESRNNFPCPPSTGATSEWAEAWETSQLLAAELRDRGFQVLIPVREPHVGPYDVRLAEAAKWGADAYLSIHSDAAGSTCRDAKGGSFIVVPANAAQSGKFHASCIDVSLDRADCALGESILQALAPITRGRHETGYYAARDARTDRSSTACAAEWVCEVGSPLALRMPTGYIEVETHDTRAGAEWVATKNAEAARAIAAGVEAYFGKPAPAAPTPSPSPAPTPTPRSASPTPSPPPSAPPPAGVRPEPVVKVEPLATSAVGAVFVVDLHFPTPLEAGIPAERRQPLEIHYTVESASIEPGDGQHIVRALAIDPKTDKILEDVSMDIFVSAYCKGAGFLWHVAGAVCDLAALSRDLIDDVRDADRHAAQPGIPMPKGMLVKGLTAREGEDVRLLVWMERTVPSSAPWEVAVETRSSYRFYSPTLLPIEANPIEGTNPARTLRRTLDADPAAGAEPARVADTDRKAVPGVRLINVASSREHAFLVVEWSFPTAAKIDAAVGAPERRYHSATYTLDTAALLVDGGGHLAMALPLSPKPDDPWRYQEASVRAGASTGCLVVGLVGTPVAGLACGVLVTAGSAAWDVGSHYYDIAEAQRAETARVVRGVLFDGAPFDESPAGSTLSYLVWVKRAPSEASAFTLAVDTDYRAVYGDTLHYPKGIPWDANGKFDPPGPESGASRQIAVFAVEGDGARFRHMREWPAPPSVLHGSVQGSFILPPVAPTQDLPLKAGPVPVSTARFLGANPVAGSGYSALLRSPADLLIEDELGRAIGFRGGVPVSEIPGASMAVLGHEQAFHLPAGHTYRYTVNGTGQGTYTLHLTRYGETAGDVTSLYVSGVRTSPGLVDRIAPTKDWSALAVEGASGRDDRTVDAGIAAGGNVGTPFAVGFQTALARNETSLLSFAVAERAYVTNPATSTPPGHSRFVTATTFAPGPRAGRLLVGDLTGVAAHGQAFRLAAGGSWVAVGGGDAPGLDVAAGERVTIAVFEPRSPTFEILDAGQSTAGTYVVDVRVRNTGEREGPTNVTVIDRATRAVLGQAPLVLRPDASATAAVALDLALAAATKDVLIQVGEGATWVLSLRHAAPANATPALPPRYAWDEETAPVPGGTAWMALLAVAAAVFLARRRPR